MVRDGYYYALGAAVAATLVSWLTTPVWGIVPLALGAFFLWFFRDPKRVAPTAAGAIVSAADGKVTHIDSVQMDGTPRARISVFLSVFDVHVNRAPVAGAIRKIEYRRGKFLNAMSEQCAVLNEQNAVTVEGESGTIVFKQIAGVLARRIVFTKKVGEVVACGERVGMIKFGSRTDVIFHPDADIRVKVGDRVRGGETVLAVVRSRAERDRIPAGQTSTQGGDR